MEVKVKSYVDSAHGGDGWVERKTYHIDDIGTVWANCGVRSETDELRHVLLRRPGNEICNIDNPANILWTSTMDYDRAIYQHDQMAQIYRDYGVNVTYVENSEAVLFPNILYVRDTFTMTPQGAIISRLASKVRSGEEKIISSTLATKGVPIIATPFHNMKLEGPDIIIVNSDLVFLGIGLRTNIAAANYVSEILKMQGFSDIITVQTTYGCGHLDGVVNIINSKYAVIIPKRASYVLYESLKRHGYTIVELTNIKEADAFMSINFVSINNETILINKGAKESNQLYKECGVKCVEVDVSELTNGGGSVHCMTGVIWRENK